MGSMRQSGKPSHTAKPSTVSCAPYSDAYRPLRQHGSTPSRAQTNLNFLDRPLFIPARKLTDPVTGESMNLELCRTYNDGNGFEMQALVNTELQKEGFKAFFGLPGYFDKKVLYMLAARLPVFDAYLDEAVELLNGDKTEVIRTVEITSIRGFLRDLGAGTDGRTIQRLKESLLRWKELILSFHNNSMTTSKTEDGDVIRQVVESTRIQVLDRVVFDEDSSGKLKAIRLTFSKDFLLCNNDKFTRRVPLDIFCSFKRPTAARLYEIISKNFWGTSGRKRCARTGAPIWSINMDNLLAKLGTHRVRNAKQMIKEAVLEINERVADVFIIVKFKEGKSGQVLVEFTRHDV